MKEIKEFMREINAMSKEDKESCVMAAMVMFMPFGLCWGAYLLNVLINY